VTTVTVMIVDDDALMRAGLRAILSTDDTLQVVAEATDGQQAIALAAQSNPDVVLMDIRMPFMDGISATRHLTAAAPASRILVLTTFEDDDYIFSALQAGASGFLLKRAQPEELTAAIHTIAAGDSLLAPSITRTVIDRVLAGPQPAPADDTTLDRLTPRERDVFELIARGCSNSEIAATLVVEESTVKSHVKRILAKLALRDRVQAVIVAYETGLILPGRPNTSVGAETPPIRGVIGVAERK
jgi:DNA-binding NarL/FixJ family response regulator